MKRFLSAGEGYALFPTNINYRMSRYFPAWRAPLICVFVFFMCLHAGAMEPNPIHKDRAVPAASTTHISTSNGHRQVHQQTTLTGVVTDTAGRAIEGATIAIKGSRMQVMTDGDGQFSLQTDASSGTLIVTHIGHQTVEQRFGAGNFGPFRFVLLPNDQALEEVEINAGYYTVKDRERTGSISRITAEEIARQPVTNPMAAMIGRMPGVDVVQTNGAPGGGFRIQIRGQNSLRSDGNDPLYIIDGVPVPTQQVQSIIGANIRFGSGPFGSLNPTDIESIEVLKDADATAIYGSRGANGVILVTTRKGSMGKPVSNLSLSHGLGEVGMTVPLLNTAQYLEMRREAFANDGKQPGPADYDVNGTWDETRYTNWQKELLGGTAYLTNARYSISGGEERTRFLIGAGYSRETSVMPVDDADHKISTNFNINHHSTDDRFNIQFSGNYSVNISALPRYNPMRNALTLPPNAPSVFDREGNLNWEGGTWSNPMSNLMQNYKSRINMLVGNALVSYEFVKGLRFKTNFGFNAVKNKEHASQPLSIMNPYLSGGSSAHFANGDVQTWIIEPQLSFQRKIGADKLNIMFGSTIQESLTYAQTLRADGFSSDALLGNPQAGATLNISSVSEAQYRYQAIFGRINYNLNERYIVNLTGRRDGSSRFGPGRQYANFGAIGVAWLFGEEPVIKRTMNFISHGKLRTSYGITGSDQIGDYGFYDTWNTATYPYAGVVPLRPARLFNPEYGWEENRKLEVGLEMGFWEDRLQLSASYYQNRSGNQLISARLPSFTGFGTIRMNMPAEVQNTGLEFSIKTINIESSSFKWSSDILLTIPRSKLLSYPDINTSVDRLNYQVGKSMDVQYAYHSLGVDPITGLYTFLDADRDGRFTIQGDYFTRKDRGKQYYGGYNSSFSYKGFSLDLFIQFVKQTGYDYRSLFTGAPGRMTNQPVYVLDRWQQDGDQVIIQRFTSGPGDANTRFNLSGDDQIVDASFIRLKNVMLRYRLPIKKNQLSSTFYLNGQNLVLFTNYRGMDPESARSPSASVPPLRMISLGYELTF